MMTETMQKTTTAEVLTAVYKNVKMGGDSIVDLLPKVKSEALRKEMTAELERYEELAKDIREALFALNVQPREENLATKAMTKMGIMMNTLTDTTASHIADMMIQGATMGVTDATKLIREHENAPCSEEALTLARKVVEFEEASIEKLKSFL